MASWPLGFELWFRLNLAYRVHPGPQSLPPLCHSQSWSGSVHPGEGRKIRCLFEVITWVWLQG